MRSSSGLLVMALVMFAAATVYGDTKTRLYGFLSHSGPGKAPAGEDWVRQNMSGTDLFGAGFYFRSSRLQTNLAFFQTTYATMYDVQIGLRYDQFGLYYGKHSALTSTERHKMFTPQYVGLHFDMETGDLNFRVDAQYGFGKFTVVRQTPPYVLPVYFLERENDFSIIAVAPQVSYRLYKSLNVFLTLGWEKYNFSRDANLLWSAGLIFGDVFQRFFAAPRSVNYDPSDLPDGQTIKKPNIYLYPESPMPVLVELFPRGRITTSIPDYGDGWSVFVEPDGRINDTFGFLFYEAQMPLVKPEAGWCIKAAELESFFATTLAAYGFSEREIADFLDYWVPVLAGAEFVEIRPLVNEQLDAFCPIAVTPQPDHLLRLWFLFTPTNRKTTLSAPAIPFFARSGFVATEWGGAMVD